MKKKLIYIALFMLIALSATTKNAYAKPPNQGDYATVTQVQTWLSELEASLTDYIDGQIASVQAQIATLTSTTAINANNISQNVFDISIMLNELANNTTAIDANTDDTAYNSSSILTLQSNLSYAHWRITELELRIADLETILGVGTSAP